MPEQHTQQPASLTLQVVNGNELESGRAAKCVFTAEGGDVGHSEHCHWPLQDRSLSIADHAFTLCWHDGAFCLRNAISGLEINQAPLLLDTGIIHLKQGDEIRLGSLLLKVYIGDMAWYEKRMATPETIVTNNDRLTSLLTTDDHPEYSGIAFHQDIAPTVANNFSQDPLTVLQAESLTAHGYASSDIRGFQQMPPMSDLANKGDINTRFMDLPTAPSQEAELSNQQSDENIVQHHVAASPLMRGLDCALPLHDSEFASDFLEEIGQAMQATVKGLLNLQHQRNSLSDKHLRPLEDNPFRLNMDYETAMNVLFSDGKSPVHLSAPAAIAESLRNVRHHEEANKAAITEALRVMLEAFSPASLLRRFAQYRRSHEQRQEMDDAWAWRMYSSYYAELASSRQQGFEMLFNEVYAQVYDRVLREKQREPEV